MERHSVTLIGLVFGSNCASLHEPPVLWDGRKDIATERKIKKEEHSYAKEQEKRVLSGHITNLVTFGAYENDSSYCWSLRGRAKIKCRDANKYGEEKERSKREVVEVGNRNALKAGISRRYRGG